MDLNMKLRERFDTGCTVDSKDSGIDVLSKMNQMRPMRNMKRLMKEEQTESERFHLHSKKRKKIKINIDIDTFLWICCFGMTCWVFKLPISVWFSTRTNWTSMYVSILFAGLFWLSGCYLYWKQRTIIKWRNRHSVLYPISWTLLIGSAIAFCHATWMLFYLWSVYISFVTIMFLNAVVPLLIYLCS